MRVRPRERARARARALGLWRGLWRGLGRGRALKLLRVRTRLQVLAKLEEHWAQRQAQGRQQELALVPVQALVLLLRERGQRQG